MSSLNSHSNENDHYLGRLTAPVILVEYGDFQCPFCAMAAPVVERLMQHFGRDLCFVYRHFPLTNIHPMAELAALASEAADQQDQFWLMQYLLFQNSTALSKDVITALAREIGLNRDQFEQDLGRLDLKDRINRDRQSATLSRVNGTPTFYVNGTRLDQPVGYSTLLSAILGRLINHREAESLRP